MKNAPAKCSYGAFLLFACHAKPVLVTSAISYSFGCQDSPVMDFGGFNSAQKAPPSPSFSPILDVSLPSRMLVQNPSAQASLS